MQIPIAGVILLSSLGSMVQAYTVFELVFYSDNGCQGESHKSLGDGPLGCGKPPGTPAGFDAKSVSVHMLKPCAVSFFTDHNSKCNINAPASPITKYGPFLREERECVTLPSGKFGKWKVASVTC
ncbi:unnamed protein product [Zymoseptoria tritici ST99CH_1A5]|uniref:Secreted protein n=1 Tax=Zymoseptoria tritici ST99CH_1A5 TaxID=1276529 RepID=A0A1Y6LUU1_ZYMTR|nr:unnamed protein product [Zymoseptoria tritici ST99CH_3D1]SMY27399.1 unnamed protein product [Zymoseptoria tritici ST99CH_1A5]